MNILLQTLASWNAIYAVKMHTWNLPPMRPHKSCSIKWKALDWSPSNKQMNQEIVNRSFSTSRTFNKRWMRSSNQSIFRGHVPITMGPHGRIAWMPPASNLVSMQTTENVLLLATCSMQLCTWAATFDQVFLPYKSQCVSGEPNKFSYLARWVVAWSTYFAALWKFYDIFLNFVMTFFQKMILHVV